jgi:hypothetical protein
MTRRGNAMGYVIDISRRVSVELRRSSAVLTVGDDRFSQRIELDYKDVEDAKLGLETALDSSRYRDDEPRRRKVGRVTERNIPPG